MKKKNSKINMHVGGYFQVYLWRSVCIHVTVPGAMPGQQGGGSTEGKVKNSSVPDTVIVVTDGVMPASL